LATGSSAVVLSKASQANRLILALVFGVIGSAVIFAVWSMLRGAAVGVTAGAMKIVPVTSLDGSEDQAAFSPDGNQIAFVWNGEKEDNRHLRQADRRRKATPSDQIGRAHV